MTDFASQQAIADAGRREAIQATERSPAARIAGVRGHWWRDALRRRMLAAADVTATTFAVLIVAIPTTGSLWALAMLPVAMLVAKLLGLYDRDHRALRHLTADEVPALAAWAVSVATLVALLLPLTDAEPLGGFHAALFALVAFVAATGLRALARFLWWRRVPPEKVGIVGDGPLLESLRRKFGMFREMHLELAAELRVGSTEAGPARTAELRGLAGTVDRIVVATSNVDTRLIGELKELCHRRQVKLSVVSPFRGEALPLESISQLADLPILEYNTWDP
jgi:hypothetical protein